MMWCGSKLQYHKSFFKKKPKQPKTKQQHVRMRLSLCKNVWLYQEQQICLSASTFLHMAALGFLCFCLSLLLLLPIWLYWFLYVLRNGSILTRALVNSNTQTVFTHLYRHIYIEIHIIIIMIFFSLHLIFNRLSRCMCCAYYYYCYFHYKQTHRKNNNKYMICLLVVLCVILLSFHAMQRVVFRENPSSM